MIGRKWMILTVTFILFWLFLNESRSVRAFIENGKHAVRHNAAFTAAWDPSASAEDPLYQKILEAAKTNNQPAVNARIDRVWKAIPGYDGLKVDVEKSYRLARSGSIHGKLPLVYDEVAPAVSLSDLPPNPIYKGNPKKPMAAIMINVAWGNPYIPAILDTLRKANVHATFFFDGSWLSKNLELAEQIQKDGNELSNHGYSHKNMSTLSRQAAEREISRTQALLTEMHVKNRLFAPPSGDYDTETVDIAHSMHLQTILWTVDTLDWKNPSPAWIVQKINRQVEPGALILMHPTRSSSMALAAMIQSIKNKGLALGTVSELISSGRIPKVESPLNF